MSPSDTARPPKVVHPSVPSREPELSLSTPKRLLGPEGRFNPHGFLKRHYDLCLVVYLAPGAWGLGNSEGCLMQNKDQDQMDQSAWRVGRLGWVLIVFFVLNGVSRCHRYFNPEPVTDPPAEVHPVTDPPAEFHPVTDPRRQLRMMTDVE